MKILKQYISIIMFVYVSTNLVFANDQTYVLGIGTGGASLASNQELSFTSEEVKIGMHFYFEWYLLDSVGLGIESSSLSNGPPCTESTKEISACEQLSYDNQFAKLNWIISGEKDYSRWGLTFGAGISSLSYSYSGSTFTCKNFSEYTNQCTDWGTTKVQEQTCTSDTGPYSSAGLFFDWGADGFGARLGYDAVSSQVGKIKCNWIDTKIEGVSSTGGLGYLDFRWAF